jgi:chromosomal replication initiation ATPase DnaA
MKPHATRAAFEAIKAETCDEFKIDGALFDSASRIASASAARHLAWWRARDRLTVSYRQLGEWSGGRDLTTVWHGVQSLACWLQGQESASSARKRTHALEYWRAKKARGEI